MQIALVITLFYQRDHGRTFDVTNTKFQSSGVYHEEVCHVLIHYEVLHCTGVWHDVVVGNGVVCTWYLVVIDLPGNIPQGEIIHVVDAVSGENQLALVVVCVVANVS